LFGRLVSLNHLSIAIVSGSKDFGGLHEPFREQD
jgi:hypothetical protein